MSGRGIKAPTLETAGWLNTPQPMMLESQLGKVVVLHAFQMLCPGCVTHGLPQAAAIHELYGRDEVQVIGLHTVFEHHSVMTFDALKAFVHEYRLRFPIAMDKPSGTAAIPVTMQKLNLQGTPSLVLIDKQGYIRAHHFGRVSDLQVGDMIGKLLMEPYSLSALEADQDTQSQQTDSQCSDDGCRA